MLRLRVHAQAGGRLIRSSYEGALSAVGNSHIREPAVRRGCVGQRLAVFAGVLPASEDSGGVHEGGHVMIGVVAPPDAHPVAGAGRRYSQARQAL